MIYRSNNGNDKNDNYITIITKKKIVKLHVQDIEVAEQEGRKLHLVTAEDDFVCYDRLENIVDIFRSKNFYRLMKRLVVNQDKIFQVADGQVYFESGASICMGRNKYNEMKKEFERYTHETCTKHLRTDANTVVAEGVMPNSYKAKPYKKTGTSKITSAKENEERRNRERSWEKITYLDSMSEKEETLIENLDEIDDM